MLAYLLILLHEKWFLVRPGLEGLCLNYIMSTVILSLTWQTKIIEPYNDQLKRTWVIKEHLWPLKKGIFH